MSQLFSKLGFIHRRLWDRDGIYRISLLLGPAPLVGCGLAAGIWIIVQALPVTAVQPPNWGKPPRTADNWSTTDEPQTLAAARPIPPAGADGGLSGYEAGWRGTINPIEIKPTMDVDVKSTALSAFFLDGSKINMAQIIAAGPKNAPYVGLGNGFLVVRTPGVYALSIRLERPLGPVADCLTRLAFGPRRIVSNLILADPGNISKTYDAARFNLQPGLYPIAWAFGCWHDREVVGPGRITVLISHPGDQALQPALPDEIVRAERVKP
ncbi:hypothetical protein [Beijerinckia indica]|uniref:Uncharacterized protein n=1 Tax=Beijerinckia indica subsp. indica (strain ATCC 9039 / DSM 1715 / NCIMB 8712) TaxID=395963 RepID=B2IJZ3_BEII9|nr:hypothetical protein [Beijerinckia indica]ACB96368.1 hypothetical protein Bind_2799 [Beijerinckia indica subsp. indica ATCC 9039]